MIPSHAVFLAVMSGKPIFVEKKLAETQNYRA
jgi:bifunctional DNase/RNase